MLSWKKILPKLHSVSRIGFFYSVVRSHEPNMALNLQNLVLGLLAAAATCATSFLIAGVLHSGTGTISLAATFFVIYFVWGLAVAVVLGLPVFFALRIFGLVHWWSALAAGALIGTVVGWAFSNGTVSLGALAPWLCSGALSALAFWSVWGWSKRRY